MDQFKAGDLVCVSFGKIPMIGTVAWLDLDGGRILVRFPGAQQMYFAPEQLKPYDAGRQAGNRP